MIKNKNDWENRGKRGPNDISSAADQETLERAMAWQGEEGERGMPGGLP